jgi:hypothetical protein
VKNALWLEVPKRCCTGLDPTNVGGRDGTRTRDVLRDRQTVSEQTEFVLTPKECAPNYV